MSKPHPYITIAPVLLQMAEDPQEHLNDSLEDDLGPNFNDMGDFPNVAAPENALGTAIRLATRAVDK